MSILISGSGLLKDGSGSEPFKLKRPPARLKPRLPYKTLSPAHPSLRDRGALLPSSATLIAEELPAEGVLDGKHWRWDLDGLRSIRDILDGTESLWNRSHQMHTAARPPNGRLLSSDDYRIGCREVMGSEGSQLQIPRVDFRGLTPSIPGGEAWDATRTQVMSALQTFGCFEALYDVVSQETKDELFFRSVPDLFRLPTETKTRNLSTGLLHMGYVGQIPNMAYESLRLAEPDIRENVEQFASSLWPEGNPTFSNAIWTYAKGIRELEQMVHRMILQCMGTEGYYDSLVESLTYALRLAEYGVPVDQESKIALNSHLDPGMLTIVCQHQIEGLEVQTGDGEWIHVVPHPNSFNVMIGESFEAWSNGRLQSPFHRVRVTGDQTRYSIIFGSRPEDDTVVEAPKELVDEEHPSRFKPFCYSDYIRFNYGTEEGRNAIRPVHAFAGVGETIEVRGDNGK